MAVGVKTYGTHGHRVGLLTPDPYQTRRAPRRQDDEQVPTGRFRPAFADDPRAACNPHIHPGVQPDWWYAPEGEGRDGSRFAYVTTKDDADRAVGICRTCPLRWPCLRHAIGDDHRPPEPFGIWGGEKFPAGPARRRELAKMVAAQLCKATS